VQVEATEIEATSVAGAPPKVAGKARLLSLADIDQRTTAYRRTSELIGALEADLGGADQLSVAERQLIRHAAVTGALLEDQAARWLAGEAIDPALYATLGNHQRRLFETVGLKRVARDVTSTLHGYLASKRTSGHGSPATGHSV
jgi:hypothetical protein